MTHCCRVPSQLRSSSKLADPKTETKADTNECASQDVEAIDSSKEEPHAQTTEAEADANKVIQINRHLMSLLHLAGAANEGS